MHFCQNGQCWVLNSYDYIQGNEYDGNEGSHLHGIMECLLAMKCDSCNDSINVPWMVSEPYRLWVGCVCRAFSAWNSIVLSAVLVGKWKGTSLQVLLHHGTCTNFSGKKYHPHVFWCQEIKTDRLAWCGKWRGLLHQSEWVTEGFTSIK